MSTPASPPPRPWEPSPAPEAQECCAWDLDQPRQLATARRGARRCLTRDPDGASAETADHVVMVLEELASNALRHGSPPASIELCRHADGWLVIATDAAPERVPSVAVDRPAERGGMGLHMVSRLTVRHGVYRDGRAKTVWALVAS
ncbi:ATP-binding protein [Geodermatophilus sp. SYSU D00705]